MTSPYIGVRFYAVGRKFIEKYDWFYAVVLYDSPRVLDK